MFLRWNTWIYILCLVSFCESISARDIDRWPVPVMEKNPTTDAAGNTWGVYQTALSDASDFSRFVPMIGAKDQWLGSKAMFGHPSYHQGGLTGSRNGAYTGAMVFTPKEPGKYALTGTLGFASSGGSVYVAVIRFDGRSGRTLYDGWHAPGTTLELDSIAALQRILMNRDGRLAILVTGEEGQFGKVTLDRCAIQSMPVLRLNNAPDDFSRRNTTPTRDMICLNGRWDWQKASGMLYNPFANRELFPKPDSPLPAPNTSLRPEHADWDTALVPNHPPQTGSCQWGKNWYRRTIHVPREWQGRRVELTFMGAGFEIIAFVNGQCAGSHLGDVTGFSIDITDHVKYGQDNELMLSVWWHWAVYGEVWQQGIIETIWSRRTGLWDDVYLTSRPKTSVENVFCKTSFRKKKLTVDVTVNNAADSPSELTVESIVLDRDGKEVLKLGPTRITAGAKKQTTITLEKPWVDPHLWWPHDPYLYVLETRLVRDGKVADVHRERFGFREIWIDGRDFLVNGKIHHFHCITHDPGTGHIWDQNPAWIRAMLRQYKAAGYTMVRTFAKPSYILMEAADEVGIYLKIQSGWHHPNNLLTEEFKKNAGQTVRDWIVRDRNHPSIAMWDAANEPAGQYESVHWVMDQIRKYDPTRPVDMDRSYGVAIYNGDGVPKTFDNYNVEHKQYTLGRFEIANPHYPITCGLPYYSLSTAAEYPARWMTMGKIPLFFGEWGDFSKTARTTSGPDHYKDISQLRELVWGHGFEFAPEGWLTYLEEIMPHWRRYKVSGFDEWLSHTTLSWMKPPMGKENDLVDPNHPVLDFVWDRLDTPGLKFESFNYLDAHVNPGWFKDLPEWQMDEHWRRYSRIWKPRFAFFHDKTRAVYGGRSFSRSLTLINDTLEDAVMQGTITLTIADKTVVTVPFKTEVRQGDVKDIPVQFDLPGVDRRTPAKVTIMLQGRKDDQNTKPLELDIFPAFRLTPGTDMALYDPAGETAKAFYRQKTAFRRLRNPGELPASTGVLIIGENGLDDKVLTASEKIIRFVEKGGRVVCLAQNEWKDWLPVKIRQNRDIDTPLTYILYPRHPLFDGLESRDFCWWPNNRNQKFKIPGAVADKPFFKPLSGPARSLLECGSTLELSALIEVRHGAGEFYLSQLKLADILGESPVADRVLDRLIHPVRSESKDGSPINRTIWFAGDDVSRAMLTDRLGAQLSDLARAGDRAFTENDLVVWIPNAQPIAPAVGEIAARAVKQGAALLAVAGDAKELFPLDSPPVYGDAMRYAGQVYILQTSKPDAGWVAPEGRFIKLALVDRSEPLVDGVSNAEMSRCHHRHGTNKLADYEIEPKNGWRPVTDPGVIAVRDAAHGKGPQVVVTAVRNGPTSELAKYEQMIHSLLLNLGGIHRGQYKPKIISGDTSGAFFTVDLRSYCNMGFADEVANDGKGGWGDQGPQNDLRNFPVGPQKFLNVPFDIIDPATNAGKSCITLGSAMLKALPRTVKTIDFGHRKAKRIYFLHSMTWAPPEGIMGEYRIHYGKALEMRQTIVLESGKNIGDWYRPSDLEDARVAWRGNNAMSTVGVYIYVWENPHPDTVIDEIDFTGTDANAIMHLVAITGQE